MSGARHRRRPEDAIQRAVFQHLRARAAPGVFAFHVPNGGYRKPVEAVMSGRRRQQNFCFAAKRRREIVLHARHVEAAETEDFSRWLIAWLWHNPGAKDQIWSPQKRKCVTQITDGRGAASYISDNRTHTLEEGEHVMTWTSDRAGVVLYTVLGMLIVLSSIYIPA
jgi:hypothetical protein